MEQAVQEDPHVMMAVEAEESLLGDLPMEVAGTNPGTPTTTTKMTPKGANDDPEGVGRAAVKITVEEMPSVQAPSGTVTSASPTPTTTQAVIFDPTPHGVNSAEGPPIRIPDSAPRCSRKKDSGRKKRLETRITLICPMPDGEHGWS